MSPGAADISDRMALRDLAGAYAHAVDRREFDAVALLFTESGRLTIGDRDRLGREEIAQAMTGLARYEVTTHFLGQQSVVLDGDRATGETYCLAHHVSAGAGQRTNTVMSIRYLDTFVRSHGTWLIETRVLAVDWVEHRPMPTGPPSTP